MRRERTSNDQRLTVYLPEGAVPGRVTRFTETGLIACVEAQVPRHERFRFTLHLQGGVVAGELVCLAQEDRECRLQFDSLTERDRRRLEPLIEPES